MKYRGSVCDFNAERDKDLLRAYREQLALCDRIRMGEIARKIASSPSARFWVSEERAGIVVQEMLQGKTLDDMLPTKQRMFREIYNRFVDIKKNHPSLTNKEIIFHVVNAPAPEFYLTWQSVIVLLHKIRKAERIRALKSLESKRRVADE